jgi:uncharacterized damage-inducible protein DinB
MSNTDELMAQLVGTADKYSAVIGGLSEEALKKRPDKENWSAVEIICHMRDVDEAFFFRFKTVLDVDDYKFPAADADRWAADRQYIRNNAVEALSAFRTRREENIELLKTLKPEQWERAGTHSKHGRMTITNIVELMVRHDNDHLEQLKKAIAG